MISINLNIVELKKKLDLVLQLMEPRDIHFHFRPNLAIGCSDYYNEKYVEFSQKCLSIFSDQFQCSVSFDEFTQIIFNTSNDTVTIDVDKTNQNIQLSLNNHNGSTMISKLECNDIKEDTFIPMDEIQLSYSEFDTIIDRIRKNKYELFPDMKIKKECLQIIELGIPYQSVNISYNHKSQSIKYYCDPNYIQIVTTNDETPELLKIFNLSQFIGLLLGGVGFTYIFQSYLACI